jgi:cob(I)alamin adenosyltransferase
MVAQIHKTQVQTGEIRSDRPKLNKIDTSLLKTLTRVTPIQGNVQVFIAPHRNLNADVIAQALRVAGQGSQVLLVQLFQTGINQGLSNPRRLVENFEWIRCDAQRELSKDNIELTDVEKASILDLWDYAKVAIKSATAGLIVLDEANLLVARSLITEEELLQVLETRSPKVNIILVGNSMPDLISDYADQVTHRRH